MKKQHTGKPGGKRKSPIESVNRRPDGHTAKWGIGLLGVVSMLVCATAAHLYVNVQGPGYVGPLLVLDHVFDLMLALALLAICAGVGTFVLVRCGHRFDQPLEALVFSTAIGGGLLSTSILICGMFSGLRAPILGALLLLCAFLARKELRELPAVVAHSVSSLRANSRVFSLVISGAVAFFMLVLAMAPPLDWDSLMYHLRVPAQFLQQGKVYVPEDNLHSAYVQLAHMLYLPFLAFASLAGPALVSTLFALVLGLAVFAFCLRFLNADTAGLALPLLWGSAFLPLVALTPRVDVTLALYLFLAHYALLMALSGSASGPLFFSSAALLGMAVGIKYSALLYMLALSPLIFWAARSRSRSVVALSRALVLYGLLAFATALPWLFKNWLFHHAPLYPFFAARVIDPWLAPFYGGQGIGTQVFELIKEWHRQVSRPFNLLDLLVAPGRLTIEDEAAFYSLNPIFLLLPLWLIFVRDPILSWLMVPAVCYVIGLVSYFPSNNLRYLIPAVAPLTIVAASIIERLKTRLFSAKGAAWASVLVVAVAVWPSAWNMGLWLSKSKAMKYLIGTASREDYMRTAQVPAGSRAYSDIAFYVNRHVPQESRVLMLFDARGYYFTVPVIQDNVLTNWPLLARTEATVGCLRSIGISHVLVNISALDYYTRRGLDSRILQWERFGEFAQRCLVPVHQGNGYILYRVRE